MTPKRFILFVFLLAGIAAWAQQDDDVIFRVELNGKWGYIKYNGEYLIEPQFDAVENFKSPYGYAKVGNIQKVYYKRYPRNIKPGTYIIFPEYDGDGDCYYYEKMQYGLIDAKGNIVVEPQYDDIRICSNGYAFVQKNHKWGLIDKTGKIIVKPKFNNCYYSFDDVNGLAAVEIRRKYVYEKFGITVYLRNWYKDRKPDWYVQGRYGYIDTTGKFVIKPQFHYADRFYPNGWARVEKYGNCGFPCAKNCLIDTKGKVVLKTDYYISYINNNNNLIFIKPHREYMLEDREETGIMDMTGKIILEPRYKISPWSYYYYIFLENGKYGIMNPFDKTIIVEPKFDNIGYLHNGLAPAKINGKYGYIDTTGTFVIEPQFDKAGGFQGNLARVSVRHKYGFIDKTGMFVIEPQFDEAELFYNGLAQVFINDSIYWNYGKYGYVDTTGRMVIEPQFTEWRDEYGFIDDYHFQSGMAKFRQNGKYGFIDTTGKVVIEPQYDHVWEDFYKNNYAIVEINGKYGVIDKTGKFVIEPKYDHIQLRNSCW